MKKTILSILILALGITVFAQGKRDDRRGDDRRGDDRRGDDRRYEEKRPHAPAHLIVHKPAPVKFVVKKERPRRDNIFNVFARAILPPLPPSRAVVILNATPSTPVYEMSQLDRQPQLIESPTINYPENMANAGVSGEVIMDVQIDKNGYVGLERVVSSTNSEFEREAIASLNTFKYEQPLRGGYPVNSRFTLTMPFEISE